MTAASAAPRRRHNWTPAEQDALVIMLEQGMRIEEIAHRLGRSREAIDVRATRTVSRRALRPLNPEQLAPRLGIDPHTVIWWIDQGWLRARRSAVRGRRLYIQEDDLLAFLEDRRYWHLWLPERIADAGWREWATEMRAGVRYLTTGEVARRLSVTNQTVWAWIRKGFLPAVRYGPNWLVLESDLAGFVLPCDRPRGNTRRDAWTAAEDERLCQMRQAGVRCVVIAAALGRSVLGVFSRCHRRRLTARRARRFEALAVVDGARVPVATGRTSYEALHNTVGHRFVIVREAS